MKVDDKIKKVITWRILSTLCGWGISYLYLDSVTRSLELTVVIGFTMTVIHYFFERWWEDESRRPSLCHKREEQNIGHNN